MKNVFTMITLGTLLTMSFFIMSCGEDEMPDQPETPIDSSLPVFEFKIDGDLKQAVFTEGNGFVASSGVGSTQGTSLGTLESGEIYAVIFRFLSESTGTYTLQATADGSGSEMYITIGEAVYESVNITLNVTDIDRSNIALPKVTASFSGTMRDEETLEQVTITDGQIVTSGAQD